MKIILAVFTKDYKRKTFQKIPETFEKFRGQFVNNAIFTCCFVQKLLMEFLKQFAMVVYVY